MRKACTFGLLALGFIALITIRHKAASLSTAQVELTGAPASANYEIASDVLAGAGGTSSSTHYRLDDSIGQPEALGSSQSANYKAGPAYWHVISIPTPTGTPTSTPTNTPTTHQYAYQHGNTHRHANHHPHAHRYAHRHPDPH